jgi:class 3 adenylate cyclase
MPNTFPMVVAFCDLKGSTQALRFLKTARFHSLQQQFFAHCSKVVDDANLAAGRTVHNQRGTRPENPFADNFDESKFPVPWARIDKFMGDCTMFYVRCDKNPRTQSASLQQAARMVINIVSQIVQKVDVLSGKYGLAEEGITLGSRVGLASGHRVSLGMLGGRGRPGYSYTLTGETVNLAARLEHATAAEFISCVADSRAQLDGYAKHVTDKQHLHGTALAEQLIKADRQVVDLFSVCERRFQIRANEHFVGLLQAGPNPVKFRWRQIPFAPQGFDGRRTAYILGGNSLSDLFRTV